MSNVFLQAGYTWRDGWRPTRKIDADAVAAELNAVIRDDLLPALEQIVDLARDPKSAMHAQLTTDPDQMADKLHLIETRDMIDALHFRIADLRTEEEFVGPRVFATTDTPNVRRRISFRIVAPPDPPPAPAPIRVTVAPAHPSTDAAPAVRVPEPVAAPKPPAPIILTERQRRMREQLQRMAETLADDYYFAGVVAAIRSLP